MKRYADVPDEGEASREELIDLLFLKASEVMQSGLIDLKFSSSMSDGTTSAYWHVGSAKHPDAGDCCDNLYFEDHPEKFRYWDEVKCREWIDAFHEMLFDAVNRIEGGAEI